MNPLNWSLVKISSLGINDLALPVAAIGTGNPPVVTLTSLIHGDETVSLYMLYRFVQHATQAYDFTGTVRIIPIANPLAAQQGQRVSGIDFLDANRLFKGNADGTVTERIVSKLGDIAAGSELVINLHGFETDTRLTCVFVNAGSDQTQDTILRSIMALGPAILWSIPLPSTPASAAIPSFDAALASQGIPVFSLEFPRKDLASQQLADQYLNGLTRVLAHCGVIAAPPGQSPPSPPPAYEREVIYTPQMGIWIPEVPLMAEVEQGDRVGKLITLPYFEVTEHHAKRSGPILQIRPEEVVLPGRILFTLGVADTALQSRLERLAG